MRILLNGKPEVVPDPTTLRELVVRLEVPPDGVAVAVNLEVVPKAEHADRRLEEGDRVELVRAVGGG